MGQIEIDELYIGVNRGGAHYVVPVQAKGGNDQIGAVQIMQDIAYCAKRYPDLVCRPVAAQFMKNDVIALFELTLQDGALRVVEERQYKLVNTNDLDRDELAHYRDIDSSSFGIRLL